MNALTDPFIPVRGVDGRVREVGIRDALLSSDRITELADASPLAVVSQLRLLLAVAARVYPLADDGKWETLWRQKTFPAEPLGTYIGNWLARFDLFGEEPFYQVSSLTADKPAPLSKLVPEIVSGNNATLFDHSEDGTETAYTPAASLRMLLVAQCFGLGGLLKAKGTVFGSAFNHPNTTDAVIARGLTVWLTGETLFETLMLNRVLPSPAAGDAPCWEREISPEYFNRATTRGMLDRYTALSRMVRLVRDTDESGNAMVRRMHFAQGITFDKARQTDPMQAYTEDPKAGRRVVLLDKSKATWRDLPALLQMNRERGIPPEAMGTVKLLCDNKILSRQYKARLNTGGISSDKAKVNLWRHDRVSIPTALLADRTFVSDLTDRLGEAATAAAFLNGRTRRLCAAFFSPVAGMKDANKDDVSALLSQIDPRRTFWARMEAHLSGLLDNMARPEEESVAVATTEWREAVEDAFREAMESAISQLGPSPRAWRAAAAVSTRYRFKEDKNDGNPTPHPAGSDSRDGGNDESGSDDTNGDAG